jgi:DNA repair exonuclease SbcCD ATPase subunit
MAQKNIKLSAVELDAFRGFKEHVKFDFLTADGTVANLVAVFAPNGFGKTSFFEGVEWSVKGAIERFDENPTIKNAAVDEGGDILKNRDASARNGRVRLTDSEGKYFERRTSSSKNWDLLPGIVDKKSTSAIFTGLKDINPNKFIEILPQSRIDSFLSSKTPQQKYEALLDFWGGKDDSAYFVGVSRLCESTGHEIEVHVKAIADLKEEIGNIAQTEDKVIFFNQLIAQVNNSKQFKFNLQNFTAETTQPELHETTKQINSLIVTSEFDIKEQRDRKDRLAALQNGYELYQKNATERDELRKKVGLLGKQVLDFEDLQKRTKEKERLKTQLSKAQDELGALQHFESLRLQFNATAALIADLNTQKQTQNELISTLAATNSKSTKEINQYQANLNNLAQNELAIQQNLEKIRDLETRIAENEGRVLPAESRALLAKKIKAIYDERASHLQKGLQMLQHTYSQSIDVFVKQPFEFVAFQEMSDLIRRLFEANESLKKNYEQVKTDFSKAGSLDENLQKLIQFGRLHIHETHTDTCPLCQTKQQDYDHLIALIETQKKDLLGLADLREQMDNLKKEIDEQEATINDTYERFITILKDYEQVLLGQLRQAENKSVDAAGFIQHYESIAALAATANGRLKGEVAKLKTSNDSLRSQVEKATQQRKKLSDEIMRLTPLLGENKLLMDNAQARVSELEAALQMNQNLPVYVEVRNFITKNKIVEAHFITNGLQEKLRVQQQTIRELEKNLADTARQIGLLQQNPIPADMIGLKRLLEETQKNLARLETLTQQFEENFQLALKSEKIDLAAIGRQLEVCDKSIEVLNETYLKLRELQENITAMQTNLLVNEKNRELKRLEAAHTQLEGTLVGLNTLKDKVSDFLLAKINAVFNQKTINEIYRKIDPHPDLKEIKLVPEFNDVKPRLNIYAADADGNNQINPSLYLSSAQINILSLSIFLAKALQNKETMINTIFMDDPIQYLDSINVLSFIDLIRTITTDSEIDRQVVISTHDEIFFKLLQRKFDTAYYPSKFIKFDSYGKVAGN